jgi:hypothetical protein
MIAVICIQKVMHDGSWLRSSSAAARNPLIEDCTRAHWCHIRRAMGAMLQHAGSREAVWDEHT